MRLVYVLEQLLAPIPGGTGRYSRELARAVAACADPTDWVGSVIGWHADRSPAHVDGVEGPRRLPVGPRLLAASWQRGLPPRVPAGDVVHAPTPLAPSRRGRPLVVTVHDAVPWTHPETLTAHGASWHRKIVARAVGGAAVLVTPTQAVADELSAVFPRLEPERLQVLGGGVSAALLREPSAIELAAVHALDLPPSYLLAVATLEPRKGLDVAIAALARLGRSAPTLVVVGQPGWGGLDLAEVAGRAGLAAGTVRVLGRVPDGQLGVLLRGARALILPSRAEGFGLPVAEAMAVGTAVICSDVPALAEVAGGAAVLVPPGDADALAEAIRTVLQDAGLRRELSARGLIQAERHSWPAVAARAWALYRRLG